ncbi:MAG: 30S ribosomal protein S4 [bacterium]|nr:30S ribosomal protein S4 [bacterium]
MGRYLGPKVKLMRREGVNLELKSKLPKSFEKEGIIPPGQHCRKGRKKISGFGLQLREKQKAKRIYGIFERQFKKYALKIIEKRGRERQSILTYLERRLDNVIYRLGFAPTRAAARQIVGHGHVSVNGRRVDIPSYSVKSGDLVALGPRGLNIPVVKELVGEKQYHPPEWLERKATVGKITRLPAREDINTEIDEQLIIEYYSK